MAKLKQTFRVKEYQGPTREDFLNFGAIIANSDRNQVPNQDFDIRGALRILDSKKHASSSHNTLKHKVPEITDKQKQNLEKLRKLVEQDKEKLIEKKKSFSRQKSEHEASNERQIQTNYDLNSENRSLPKVDTRNKATFRSATNLPSLNQTITSDNLTSTKAESCSHQQGLKRQMQL